MTISKLVILDSGHNEYVAGKQAPDGSMREWEFNNDMQYKIKKRCEDHKISVYLTNPSPAGKDEIGLATRCSLANNYYKNNNKPKTIFISIHSNAHLSTWSDARGTETYVASNASETSKIFGKDLNNKIVAAIRAIDPNGKDRGLKVNDFYVIKNTIMPCCLAEYAFYSNKDDLKILKNNRNELTEATIKAICEYFNVTYIPPSNGDNNSPKPEPPIVDEKITRYYKLIVGSFKNSKECLSKIQNLQSKGYPSYIDIISNNDTGLWYRGVVAAYINKAQAYKELDNMIKMGYSDSFITIYNK